MRGGVERVRGELEVYFAGQPVARGSAIAAQRYEPHGHQGYDPVTDMRLVRLVANAQHASRSEWARLKKIVDELPRAVVEVLRSALVDIDTVSARLPAAVAVGRKIAETTARELALETTMRDAGTAGLSPMAIAQRVLEADIAFDTGRRRVRVTEADVARCAYVAVAHGEVDVAEETDRVINAAVEAYLAVRNALPRPETRAQRKERELDELCAAENEARAAAVGL